MAELDSMGAHPFFSVVIPTRNRPALLRDAIHSVVLQEFDDYEVIVSDNFNDDKTRQTVDAFLANARLRYFRTDAELPMPDHWEFATTKARGRYVLVLTDRCVLKQGALARIHRIIESRGEEIPVCSWRWSIYDEARRILYDGAGGAHRGGAAVLESVSVASAWVNRSGLFALPLGFNSCYRYDAGQKIRDRFGRFFLPVSPDITSAFLLLADTPQILHIDETLFIAQGLSVSHGVRTLASTALPYMETLGIKNFYEYVPIKAPIVASVLFNDFLSVQKRARGNLAGIRVNWVEYFVACYRELLEKKGIGLVGAPALADMFAEWERALAEFDPATRRAVNARISGLKALRLRMLVKASPIGPFLVGLKRSLGASRYGSVLTAAGFRTQGQ